MLYDTNLSNSTPSVLKKKPSNRRTRNSYSNKSLRRLDCTLYLKAMDTLITCEAKSGHTTNRPRALKSAPTSPRGTQDAVPINETATDKTVYIRPKKPLPTLRISRDKMLYDELQLSKQKLLSAENTITTLTTNIHLLNDINEFLVSKLKACEMKIPIGVASQVEGNINRIKNNYKQNLQDLLFQLKEALVNNVRLEEENISLKTQLQMALSKSERLQNTHLNELKETRQKHLAEQEKLAQEKNELLYERVHLESIIESQSIQIDNLKKKLKKTEIISLENDIPRSPEKTLKLDFTNKILALTEENSEKDKTISKLEQKLAEASDIRRSNLIFKSKIQSDQNYTQLQRKYRALKDKMVLVEQLRIEEKSLIQSQQPPYSKPTNVPTRTTSLPVYQSINSYTTPLKNPSNNSYRYSSPYRPNSDQYENMDMKLTIGTLF